MQTKDRGWLFEQLETLLHACETGHGLEGYTEEALEEMLGILLNNIMPFPEENGINWNGLAKPINSLGMLEMDVAKIMACSGVGRLRPATLAVFCADNGVVEEGVSQTGQHVTSIVAQNMKEGSATAAILCKEIQADILPLDVGMIREVPIRTIKTSRGTKNFAKTAAMSRKEALHAILRGAAVSAELKAAGNHVLMIGEMGIGNTSSSSAVVAALLKKEPEEVTGRGAGLNDEQLRKKIEVIRQALQLHQIQSDDPIDILHKVGGYDLSAMTGFFLGSACAGIPVILDGFISSVPALLAYRMNPRVLPFLIASQCSHEPAASLVLKELGLCAPIQADMRTGEGCGAVFYLKLLDMAAEVYFHLPSFEEIQITPYIAYEASERKEKKE